MFARGAASEIVAGDQNPGFTISRLVEHELLVLGAVSIEALLRKQPLAETGALDGLEVLLGDDHVGVDIDHTQGRRDAFEPGEFFHRWSTETPRGAPAAPSHGGLPQKGQARRARAASSRWKCDSRSTSHTATWYSV